MIDCVLVVVSYRSANDVVALLHTVPGAVGHLSWHAIIVNNEPAEDLDRVAAEHPDVDVVEAGANLGYAGGINLALEAAPASMWTVFLNPDVLLEAGTIAALAETAGTRHAAVPSIFSGAGALQRSLRREPTVLGSLGDALLGSHWPGRPAWLGEIVRSPAAYKQVGTVDWATGAALLLPTAIATDVGLWDAARFFLYSEETDYSRRLREAGRQILFVPEASVRHRGGGSGTSNALYALLEVNRVRYFRKWHGVPWSTAFAGTVVLNNVLRFHRSRSRTALRALLSPAARATLPGGAR